MAKSQFSCFPFMCVLLAAMLFIVFTYLLFPIYMSFYTWIKFWRNARLFQISAKSDTDQKELNIETFCLVHLHVRVFLSMSIT